MKVKSESEVAQLCPTLRDSSVHGISQARVLEWIAIAFSCMSAKLQSKFDSGDDISLFSSHLTSIS